MLSVHEAFIDKLTEAIYLLLNGKKATLVDLPPQHPDDEMRQLTEYINKLIVEYDSFTEFMYSLSRGELDYDPPKGKLQVVQSFKSLQSNLRHLTWVTQQIAAGHFDHRVDFIGDFSKAFNKMTRDLKDAFELIEAQKRELEEANYRIMESIQYARSIQQAILPPLAAIEACVDDHFVIWHPRDVIGGDLFWFSGGTEKFLAAVMDCTGHGVPGAILTMIAGVALNRVFSEQGFDDPSRLLSAMNQLIKATLSRREESSLYDDGLDMAICRVDRHARTLDFAGARMSLFRVKDGKAEEIKGGRRSIGYRSSDADCRFTSHCLDMEPDDRFYMMTDGLMDQPGEQQKMPFGKKRFVEFIAGNYSKPFAEQRDVLWELFNRYKGGESQRDDVTVVGFKVDIS